MLYITDLPFPKIGAGTKNYTLPSTLLLEQWLVPAGVEIMLRQNNDFGTVILKEGTMDVRNFIIPKRIFNW